MKVLHVEDNVYKQSDIARQLSRSGIRDVTWVQTYEAGVDALESDEYDLMITDMYFPMRDGEEDDPDAGEMMIEYAARNHPGLPVILISSVPMRRDDILGVVHYASNELWEDRLRELVKKL